MQEKIKRRKKRGIVLLAQIPVLDADMEKINSFYPRNFDHKYKLEFERQNEWLYIWGKPRK